MREKITFMSGEHQLSGLLEMPRSDIKFYALFAHCFTCGKDIAAASRISRALTAAGVAVLRFDFTGLGNSDGDFENTNFSSNVKDLVAAADFLREHYHAPKLLIGHSLGGAAVLSAAEKVPESSGVVTIGAPSSASHVAHIFESQLQDIQSKGIAKVNLAGRIFTIKKQFLDDINSTNNMRVTKLKKALLVMHSPIDETVSISEAEKIYQAAMHPKSFVSLDTADHLLSKKEDAEYAAGLIATWASRYIKSDEGYQQPHVAQGHVLVEEKDHKFTQHVSTNSHYWIADEPFKVGGQNLGPDPYEHLLAGLGACTAMTLRMYADRKKLALKHVKVTLTHSRNYQEDCDNCETQNGIEAIMRHISFEGNLSTQEKARLLEIADKCPVHKTLHSNVATITKLLD